MNDNSDLAQCGDIRDRIIFIRITFLSGKVEFYDGFLYEWLIHDWLASPPNSLSVYCKQKGHTGITTIYPREAIEKVEVCITRTEE